MGVAKDLNINIHTRMFMATKTLTITEEAYERLASARKKDESFSKIIIDNFPKHSLLELAGILSNKEADELKKHIKMRRIESRKRIERIAKELQ